MKQIFLDTSYLQALVDSGDDLYPIATIVTAKLGNFRDVTNEMVLAELLNALCSRGKFLRQSAIRLTHKLRNHRNTLIIPQRANNLSEPLIFTKDV